MYSYPSLPKTHLNGLLLASALLYLSVPPPCCTGLLLDELTTTNATATPSPSWGEDGDAPMRGDDAVGIILPPGCTCRESGVAHPSRCSSFDCNCPCDLTRNLCDWECCCDVDCHVDQRSRFNECVDDEGGSSGSMKFCYQSDTVLEKVNPKYPLRIEESAEDALNGLICVVDDNSQVRGDYYVDPGFPDADVAFAPNGPGGSSRRWYDYNSHLAATVSSADASAGTMQPNGSYERGEVIPTILKVDGAEEEGYVGLLRLPSPGDGGLCTPLNALEFGVDVVESDCVQIVEGDISVRCEGGHFNVGNFVTNLSVGRRDDAGIAFEEDNFVTVEWGQYVDVDGNELNPDDSNSTTQWDESASVCLNALISLRYEIVHDVEGSITAVTAHVVTTTVDTSDLAVRQTYGVRFVQAEEEGGDDDDDVEGGDDGIVVLREKSGNPGYVVGSPTLAAKLLSPEDDQMYVEAQPGGLTIMDTGPAGFCGDSTTTTGRTKVGFAEDKFVGCMLRLTRSELRDLCTSKTSPLLSNVTLGSGTMYVPASLKIERHLLVGIFGNADPLDRNQWLRIESPLDYGGSPDRAIKERVWLPTTNVCEGLATRLTYRFLWTHVGNVEDPQAKIISARVDFDHSTPLKHTSGPTDGQNFPFITTVTWVYAAPESSTPVKPPPPTLLFSVPDDVFYPFDVGASSTVKVSFFSGIVFYFSWVCLSFSMMT